MILIRPSAIDESTLAASNISEADPGAWAAGTTYAVGDVASVASGSTLQLYKSLADDNVANDPAASVGWWAEDGVTYSEWDEATSYATGDRVIDPAGHRVYESLIDANLGNALTDPASWLDLAPTNRWAMFDQVVGTTTVHPYQIDVTAQLAGRIDSLALLGLANGLSARVIMSTLADGVVYDKSFSLIATAGITDWYAFFFEAVERKPELLVTDLPAYADPTIRVIVEGNGSSPVECGILSIGLSKVLGETLHDGAQIGITDYSRKEADDFGNYSITPRAFSRRGSFQLLLEKAAVDGVYKALSELRATAAVYAATDDYGSTLIFGFFRDFQVAIEYPTTSLCSIEIEGLT